MKYSSKNRKQTLEQLDKQQYDLIVIGGGITGTGIALDASSRGLKVALVEKKDFAAGTSSKSTKLIHGGLRYLKQFDIGLVRETGTERAIINRLAPHLVPPKKMILPLIKGGTFGKTLTSFGLWVYDVLAKVEDEDKRKMLSKKKALELEPMLPEELLEGAGFYAEYQTDDARLTTTVLKTAGNYDTTALNYLKVIGFTKNEVGKINGVTCRDELTDYDDITISGKYVINATGPWVDDVRKNDEEVRGKRLQLTKGVHLVVKHIDFPIKYAIYFDLKDGRMAFAIPRDEITYIGTTDTLFSDDKEKLKTTKEDIDYLIDGLSRVFPNHPIYYDHIISTWVGLRPLIHEDGKSPSELSRKDEIFKSKAGLLSIAGGKLTGYRKMSQRIVDIVIKQLKDQTNTKYPKSNTKNIFLDGGVFEGKPLDYLEKLTNQLGNFNLSAVDAGYLYRNYGTRCDQILTQLENVVSTYPNEIPQNQLIIAEIKYGIENELCATPGDFFLRRSGRIYFRIETIEPALKIACEILKKELNYTDQKIEDLRIEVNEALLESTRFKTILA